IPALDDVLGGGLVPHRLYLVSGDPGAGKTTLGLQFLLEGRRVGESGLYVTLSETREELTAVAASHGWSLDGIDIFELGPSAEELDPDQQYTMFHPSEVELSETTRAILERVEQVKPQRVVFDSLSEMRLLAQSPLRYRRQILALKQFFVGREATLVLLDDRTAEVADTHLQSIAHGVLSLEMLNPEYGGERRRLSVTKFRGRQFRGGYHDYRIRPGGLDVFPRLVAAEHREARPVAQLRTGVEGLDKLLGGGIEEGTSALVIGPAGTGKSTLAARVAYEVACRGDCADLFIFDESPATLLGRTASLGVPLGDHTASGRVRIHPIDPAELSPGEFAALVRRCVEGSPDRPGARVVVIDSLNGYLNAMPEEKFLIIQLHELLSYLRQKGVITLLVLAQAGLLGTTSSPVDASYLADAVLLLRYFEAGGEIRQAISVVKKRSGAHERSIRELTFGQGGVVVGETLREFQGILAGVPQ
ncbi:MAG: ATPase domain-containing protein, partial [Myxococcota bacterium]